MMGLFSMPRGLTLKTEAGTTDSRLVLHHFASASGLKNHADAPAAGGPPSGSALVDPACPSSIRPSIPWSKTSCLSLKPSLRKIKKPPAVSRCPSSRLSLPDFFKNWFESAQVEMTTVVFKMDHRHFRAGVSRKICMRAKMWWVLPVEPWISCMPDGKRGACSPLPVFSGTQWLR